MDIADLRAEMRDDPAGIGYASVIASGDRKALLALLNDPSTTMVKPLAFRVVLKWAAASGALVNLHDLAADKEADQAVRGACIAALEMMRSPHTEALDPADNDVVTMIDALAAAGVIDKTSLVELARQPASRAEAAFGAGSAVNIQQLREALRNG